MHPFAHHSSSGISFRSYKISRLNHRFAGPCLYEFLAVVTRLGEIGNLPAADNSVDVIISNCVINLSPEKDRVFREAFRALKPGGRMMVSDLVLSKPLPEALRESAEVYAACIAGRIMGSGLNI